jgi:Sigma-54 interaction domain
MPCTGDGGSSARSLLERHLLSLTIEVIPASRGAIFFYEDGFDEPSSHDDQPALGEARIDRGLRRDLPGRAGIPGDAPAEVRPDQLHGIDPGRNRHGQGIGCAHHPPARLAGQPPVRGHQSRGAFRKLFESELFGHEKGAFNGGSGSKKGQLEFAGGGTVFLDEIGEMPLRLRVNLLERVGGMQPVKLDIRLIAATNLNLEEQARAGRFRQDLYYRPNVVTLKTPALRDRACDILPLAFKQARRDHAGAAKLLGVNPNYLYRLMRNLGVR